jgi:hypothetical protein
VLRNSINKIKIAYLGISTANQNKRELLNLKKENL